MLEGLGWRNIRVLDRLARPKPSQDGLWGTADRSYNLGVTTRGRPLLNALGVTPRIRAASTPLLYRSQWTPQNPEGDRASRMTESDSHQEPTLVRRRRSAAPPIGSVAVPATLCDRSWAWTARPRCIGTCSVLA